VVAGQSPAERLRGEVRARLNGVAEATSQLLSDLRAAGEPTTGAGAAVGSELSSLVAQLKADVSQLQAMATAPVGGLDELRAQAAEVHDVVTGALTEVQQSIDERTGIPMELVLTIKTDDDQTIVTTGSYYSREYVYDTFVVTDRDSYRTDERRATLTTGEGERAIATEQENAELIAPEFVDAIPATERVVARAAADRVAAGLTEDQVVTVLAEERVALRPADDRVVAVAAGDEGVRKQARADRDQVVPAQTVDADLALAAQHHVFAGDAVDDGAVEVARVAADALDVDHVIAGRPDDAQAADFERFDLRTNHCHTGLHLRYDLS